MRNRLLRTSSNDSVIIHLDMSAELVMGAYPRPSGLPYLIWSPGTHHPAFNLLSRGLSSWSVYEDRPVDLHQNADTDGQTDEGQIQHHVAHPDRLQHLAEQPQGRVGNGVDDLGEHEHRAARLPVSDQHGNPGQDHPGEQDEQKDPEDPVDDVSNKAHDCGLQLPARAYRCTQPTTLRPTQRRAGTAPRSSGRP